MIALLLALLAAHSAQAKGVFFVDLNDSAKEVEGCKRGAGADYVTVASSTDPDFVEAQRDPRSGKIRTTQVNAESIERMIAYKERQGVRYDTVVISGHDGSGHFFGKNGNNVLSSEMADVFSRHKLKDTVSGMALWGCYTATPNSCTNYWMNNISPNIKATLGFTLQAPDNTRPGNFQLLESYCKQRELIAAAETRAEMEQGFFGLSGINGWNAGICFKNAICSRDYNKVGESGATCYHTYEELYRRCQKFDPSAKLLRTFQNYYTADDPRYSNPPPDGQDEFTAAGSVPAENKGELRRYYNQLNLWYHCAGLLAKETGYEMPPPSVVIRLTKFETLKRNFARLHAKELAQYNERVIAMGREDLVLEPERMSRQEIVSKTSSAVAHFENLAYNGNEKINGIDPYKMLIMAYGFDNSLRNLEPDCNPFSYVHENATRHSACVAQYGRYPKWPPR